MNQGLKSPCNGCERNQDGNCTSWKHCKAWAMWFENEWARVRMMFRRG